MDNEKLMNLVGEGKFGTNIKQVIDIDNEALLLNKGDHYMSELRRYNMKILLNSGEIVCRTVIIKTLPLNEHFQQFLKRLSFFENEINMYNEVLPAIKSLMDEFGDNGEQFLCEMFYSNPYDCLILEDLTPLQYTTMNRTETLNYDHLIYLVKTTAKFHAMSAVVIKRNLVNLDKFKTELAWTSGIPFKTFITDPIRYFADLIAENWGDEWSHLPKILNKACDNALDKVQEMIKFDGNRFNVIVHGGLWTNNLLFKHEEGTNTPCGIKLIDFQTVHYTSFAWDFIYLLYTSVVPKVRRAKYQEILTTYHEELCKHLNFFNFPKSEIPTLQHIFDEMERIKFFGFLLSCTFYPTFTAECRNAVDMEKIIENDAPRGKYNPELFLGQKFSSQIQEELTLLIEEGII